MTDEKELIGIYKNDKGQLFNCKNSFYMKRGLMRGVWINPKHTWFGSNGKEIYVFKEIGNFKLIE